MSAEKRTAVRISTMWIWVAAWWCADFLIHPVIVSWGWPDAPVTPRELFHEDFAVTWFVLGIWLISSRKVEWN